MLQEKFVHSFYFLICIKWNEVLAKKQLPNILRIHTDYWIKIFSAEELSNLWIEKLLIFFKNWCFDSSAWLQGNVGIMLNIECGFSIVVIGDAVGDSPVRVLQLPNFYLLEKFH